MDADRSLLPVALRNDELSEADFRLLFQKAAEMATAEKQPEKPPRKVAVGKRIPVRN